MTVSLLESLLAGTPTKAQQRRDEAQQSAGTGSRTPIVLSMVISIAPDQQVDSVIQRILAAGVQIVERRYADDTLHMSFELTERSLSWLTELMKST